MGKEGRFSFTPALTTQASVELVGEAVNDPVASHGTERSEEARLAPELECFKNAAIGKASLSTPDKSGSIRRSANPCPLGGMLRLTASRNFPCRASNIPPGASTSTPANTFSAFRLTGTAGFETEETTSRGVLAARIVDQACCRRFTQVSEYPPNRFTSLSRRRTYSPNSSPLIRNVPDVASRNVQARCLSSTNGENFLNQSEGVIGRSKVAIGSASNSCPLACGADGATDLVPGGTRR